MDKRCNSKELNVTEKIEHEKMIDEIVNRAAKDTFEDDGLTEAKMKYGYLERAHMQVITNRQLENMFREILHQKDDIQMSNNKIDELNAAVEELKNLFVEQKQQRRKKWFDIRKIASKLTKKAAYESNN